MQKHLTIIEYIKDILEDDDLDITFKKGKYVIKFIFDAKNSMTIDQLQKLRAIGKKIKQNQNYQFIFQRSYLKYN